MNKRHTAHQILDQIIASAIAGTEPVTARLKRGVHACKLLDWETQSERFVCELEGFAGGASLPTYRQSINVVKQWQLVSQDFHDAARLVTYGVSPRDEALAWPIQLGATELGLRRANGIRYATADRQTVSKYDRKFDLTATVLLPPPSIELLLARIDDWCFRFASSAVALLGAGEVAQDAFAAFKDQAERAMVTAGLSTKGIQDVVKNLQSNEPEAWRVAVLGCRNVLQDLAGNLWRDPSATYIHLPGNGTGGRLQVTQDKYINRLYAYLHQKGGRASGDDFIGRQLKRLGEQLHDLNTLASKGKTTLSKHDALMVVVSMYITIGELGLRTDLAPVHMAQPV